MRGGERTLSQDVIPAEYRLHAPQPPRELNLYETSF